MGSHTEPVDMVGARVQNKKVADTGHCDAQYNLALMLANGLGGPVDMVGARVQYKKAAAQGHMAASVVQNSHRAQSRRQQLWSRD